ncbi:MAG: hypothetical protein AAF830_02685 [Pseudomonadota bacterium]
MKQLFAAIAAIGLVSTGTSQAATVFTEDFEGPQFLTQWSVFDTWGSFMTVSGAGIEVQTSGTVTSAFSGNNYVELDSDFQVSANVGQGSNSAMAAFLPFTPGQMYRLSFLYRPRTNNVNDNGIRVDLGTLIDGGQGARSFSVSQMVGQADGVVSNQNFWNEIVMTFTAGAGDNALMFSAFGTENELGGFLDDIRVESISSVPVPAAGVFLASGLLMLAGRKRRTA